MPPSYGTTTKHALRKLLGSNVGSDIDAGIAALADDLDALIAVADSGVLASRPTSTPGSPGKLGRLYYASDEGVLYFDFGTGWTALNAKWRTIQRVGGSFIVYELNAGGTDFTPVPLNTRFPDLQFGTDGYASTGVFSGTTYLAEARKGGFRIDPADFPGSAGRLRLRATIGNRSGGARLSNSSYFHLAPVSQAGAFSASVGNVQIGNCADAAVKAVAGSTFAIPSAGYFGIYLQAMIAGLGGAAADTLLDCNVELQWTPNPNA